MIPNSPKLQPLKNIIAAQQEAAGVASAPAAPAPAPAGLIPPGGVELELPEKPAEKVNTEPQMVPPHPVLNSPDSTRQDIQRSVFTARVSFDSLTQEQKDIFMMSVVHGEPVVWDIPLLENKFVVTVRTIHNILADDLIYAWLQRMQTQKQIQSVSSWGTWLQRAHVFLRVLKIRRFGKPDELNDTASVDAVLSELQTCEVVNDDMIDKLDMFVQRQLRKTSSTDFALMARAVALHENMHVCCLDNALNGSFSLPAGTN